MNINKIFNTVSNIKLKLDYAYSCFETGLAYVYNDWIYYPELDLWRKSYLTIRKMTLDSRSFYVCYAFNPYTNERIAFDGLILDLQSFKDYIDNIAPNSTMEEFRRINFNNIN